MASKKKVSLNDYELTTTLGTGKVFKKGNSSFYHINRFIWACKAL